MMTSFSVLAPHTADILTQGLPMAMKHALRLAARIERGRLDIMLPDGRIFRAEGKMAGAEAGFTIHDYGFARRLALSGDLGFAEGYLRQEWDTPDLTAFITLFSQNDALIRKLLPHNSLTRLWQVFRHFLNRNTKGGSKRNIHAHYDLGNRFYGHWLDSTMTYSAAMFAPGDNDLAAAQTRKYRHLTQETGIEPSHHVLEIGCGWGGFAEFAAKEIGCKVTALTISQEQYAYASERIQKEGLADKVEIKLQDYRDERGLYDRIASIEMFEAVGEAYWNTFFHQLRERLTCVGRAGLQIITIRDEHFSNYRREIDFIRRYIFPGGMLPSALLMKELGNKHAVPLKSETLFGPDYAKTIAHWRDNFRNAWPHLIPLGFDERFRRMWEYYLAYCEAGFITRNIDVRQMVFAKG